MIAAVIVALASPQQTFRQFDRFNDDSFYNFLKQESRERELSK
jgi:hypothetical protein